MLHVFFILFLALVDKGGVKRFMYSFSASRLYRACMTYLSCVALLVLYGTLVWLVWFENFENLITLSLFIYSCKDLMWLEKTFVLCATL